MSNPDPVIEEYMLEGPEPTLKDLADKYWEEYVAWCDKNNVNPDISQFEIWFEENML